MCCFMIQASLGPAVCKGSYYRIKNSLRLGGFLICQHLFMQGGVRGFGTCSLDLELIGLWFGLHSY